MGTATFSTSLEAQQAAALLEGYHFELGNHDAPQWVSLWLASYRPVWIRDAVVEALYQGRYKSVSVRQILELWQKRGQPIRHVTHEFEAAVCREFGGTKLVAPPAKQSIAIAPSQPEPATRRASLRTHRSLSNISFNLSEEPIPTPPGQAPAAVNSVPSAQASIEAETALSPVYTSSRRSADPAETTETLRAHKQLNGVLFPSARAIQPFKPALPFSPQTLRLAKQKALARR